MYQNRGGFPLGDPDLAAAGTAVLENRPAPVAAEWKRQKEK